MKTELIILKMLQEKSQDNNIISDALMDGIAMYVSENHLSAFDTGDDEHTRIVLNLYLEPLMDMPVQMIIKYFENYKLITDLKMISNQVFDMSFQRLKNGVITPPISIAEVEAKANNLIARTCADSTLKKWLESEISDLILDLDYLSGKSNAYSIRLARKVGKA